MSVAIPVPWKSSIGEVRILCGALAAIVLVDAASVRAPGLALLAVPFLVGALSYRRGSGVATAVLALFAALYVLLGVAYAAGAGFDAGWGDLLFAYGGTPIAAVIVVLTGGRLLRHDHHRGRDVDRPRGYEPP